MKSKWKPIGSSKNMQALLKNKSLILFAIVMFLAMFGYRTFVGTMPETEGQSALVVGQDLLSLSNELAKATLSQDLFSLPGYRYLTDFSIHLTASNTIWPLPKPKAKA
jgi:hypothetical protein